MMPSSVIFGINNEGRVYTLSTSGSVWRELQYVGQEFKKISGIRHFLWALGGDHQIYVYVHGLDIPIKVKEEAYENEVKFLCKSLKYINFLFNLLSIHIFLLDK